MEAPDYIYPLVGFRIWNTSWRGLLQSPYLGRVTWDRGTVEATCCFPPHLIQAALQSMYAQVRAVEARGDDLARWPRLTQHITWLERKVHTAGAPHSSCHCGLYAYRDTQAAIDEMQGHYGVIAGAVQMWGNCELHRDGCRSQYARVIALLHDPYWDTRYRRLHRNPHITQDEIAAYYDVPVLPEEELQMYAMTQGMMIPWLNA